MTYYVDSTKTRSFNSGFFIKKSLVDSYLLNKNNNIFAIGGDNSSGQLGTGGLTNISSPVQLLAMANLQDIFSNGPSNVALSYGKGTYAWGNNARGILGDGSITSKSSPISIGNITINWRVISIGTTHGAGIRTNGTLWTWGDATSGALGKGSSTVHYSSPVQVGSATNWTDVSCGDAFTIAINSSNQAFAWCRRVARWPSVASHSSSSRFSMYWVRKTSTFSTKLSVAWKAKRTLPRARLLPHWLSLHSASARCNRWVSMRRNILLHRRARSELHIWIVVSAVTVANLLSAPPRLNGPSVRRGQSVRNANRELSRPAK